MQPVSRYNAVVGVEFGAEKILFNNDLSNISNSSRSAFVTPYFRIG